MNAYMFRLIINVWGYMEIAPKKIKMESIRKLSNFNFQWTKTLYQNNSNNIAFFFTFFKDVICQL